MKTTTTTREYDDEGRMVRETIVEQDTTVPAWPTITASCTCASLWWGYCPQHGYMTRTPYMPVTTTSPTITVTNTSDTSPEAVAKAIARRYTVHARV